MSYRVLFYVQHLLGIGHLKRAAAITAAMAKAGLEVTVAHGGEPVAEVPYEGALVFQLPPASIRGQDFSTLIGEDGAPVNDAWWARRREALLSLARGVRPDAVLVELYPFGRRPFRLELLPLLDELRGWSPRPAILSSVRDILVRSTKPGREEEAADIVRDRFDAVLVHGDPAFVPFDESFGETARIADRLRYTGYVASDLSPDWLAKTAEDGGEILVSAGGGAAGAGLLHAAMAARREGGAARAFDWRFLTGPRLPDADYAALAEQAETARADGGGAVAVERFRPDFPELLKRAALSVSQAGYNTTIDLLAAGTPALVVPFAGEAETEQAIRAGGLAKRGYLHVFEEAALSTGGLAAAIDTALADAPRRRAMPPADFALGGAGETARIVADHARTARAGELAPLGDRPG